MSEYDSLFSWTRPLGLLEQKAADVSNKVEQKRVIVRGPTVDPEAEAKRISRELFLDYQRTVRNAPRTWDQLIDDSAAGMANTVDTISAGLGAALAQTPIGEAAMSGLQGAVEGNLIPVPGQEAPHATASSLLRDSFRRTMARQAGQTNVSQLNRAERDRLTAEDAAYNYALALQQQEQGIPSALAQTGRVARNAVDSFGNTVSNPTTLFDESIASLPTLLVGPVAGRALTSKAAVEALAGEGARRAGLGVATEQLRREARDTLSTAGMMLGTGLTEGASGYTDAAGQILNTPIEVLAERFPEFRADLEAGVAPEAAREALAQQVGLPAGALTAAGTALAARIATRFNKDPLGLDRTASANPLREFAEDIGRETVEEGVQSGISPLAANLSQLAAGDDSIDLAEGVGEQAGQGAAAGAGLSTLVQAPGLAAQGAGAAAGTLLEGAEAGLKVVTDTLRERAEAKQAKEQEQVRAQQEVANEARRTTLTEVDTAVREAASAEAPSASAATLMEPLESEPLLAPEVVSELQGETPVGSRIEALSRTLEAMDAQAQLPEAERDQDKSLAMALFTMKTAGQLRQRLAELAPESAEAQAIQSTLLNPTVTSMEEALPQMFTPERLDQLFGMLSETPDFATPQSQQAAEQVAVLADVAPELVSSAAARSVAMYQRLAPEQKARLETVAQVAELREEHLAAYQRIGEADRKTPNIVTEEVTEKGWGKNRPSLRQAQNQIMTAMAKGDLRTAGRAMKSLGHFARHYQRKTRAYDAALVGGLQADPDQRVNVAYRTLDADGKMTTMPTAWLIPSKPGSQNLVEHIFNDGNAVVGLYNTLANAFPELNQKPLDPVGEPQYRSVLLKPAAAPATTPAAAPAEDTAQTEAALVEEARALNGDTEALVDFGAAPAADAAQALDQALAMEPKQYLDTVNPEGKTTEVASDEAIDAELADTEPSSRAVTVGKVGAIELKADGDYLYAMDGEDTVGLLIHKEDGTTFMVRSDQRGNGLGKAMMRELLLRKPMAKTNGLSPAAQATRLAVLRDLRNERNGTADTAPTVADDARASRFEGLRPRQDGSENWFLSAFQFKTTAQSLLARVPGGMRTLSAALKTAVAGDLSALRAMFLPQHQDLKLTSEQVTGLDTLINKVVPMVIQRLNQNLVKSIAEGKRFDPETGEWVQRSGTRAKGWLEDFVDGKQDVNQAQFSASVLEYGRDEQGKPFVRYQADVAQAMALASLNWVLTNTGMPPKGLSAEDEANLFPGGIPPHLKQAFHEAHLAVQPIRTLATDIVRMLGLQGKKDASVTLTDGIAKSMALDVVTALHDVDVVKLRAEEGTEELFKRDLETGKLVSTGHKLMQFIDLRNAAGAASMQALQDQIGTVLLTRLLDPESQALPSFEPSTQVPAMVSGTDQKTSAKQQEQLRKTNAVKFYRNPGLMSFAERMGDRYLQLLGKRGVDLDTLHPDFAKSVKGVNDGLDYAWKHVRSLDQMLQDHGNPDETPLYWSHYVISNGRVMQDGFGPQANKTARELFSANRVTGDLSSDRTPLAKGYYLSLAQALGIKTDIKRNSAAVREIRERLAGEAYQALFLDLQRLLRNEGDDTLVDSVFTQMQALLTKPDEPATDKAIHALVTHARLLEARANGTANQFTTYLGFELDGKTNGPINALMHFGFTRRAVLGLLRKGGLFVDEPADMTLSRATELEGKQFSDLYTDAANEAEVRIGKELGQRDSGSREANMLKAGLRMLSMAKHIELSEDGSKVGISRSMAKAGMVPTTYGSGARGVANQMAHDVMAGLVKYLSEVANGERALDPSVLKSAQYIMSSKWDDDLKDFVAVTPPNFNGPLNQMKFTREHFTALVDNLMGGHRIDRDHKVPLGAAGIMRQTIEDQLKPALDTFKLVYQASRLQMFRFNQAYQKAYAAKRAERIQEGTLHPYHALSRADEQAIRDSLKHLVPAYPLAMTGGALEGEGVFAGNRDFDGKFEVTTEKDGKKTTRNYQAESLFGGMRSDLNVRRYLSPGVKAAPLMTIGGGDATMMHLLTQYLDGTLNVYDGWEVGIDAIADKGLAANNAVLNSWKYNLLGPIAQSIQDVDTDSIGRRFSGVELTELAMTVDVYRYQRESEQDYIKRVTEAVKSLQSQLQQRAELIQHNKQVLFTQHKIAVDQMSGGENPATRNYTTAELLGDQARAGGDTAAAPIAGESAELVARLGQAYQDGLAELDHFQLQALLATFPFTDKVRKFVADRVAPLLADDVRVFIGTPEEIAAKQAALFPGEDLGDGQVPGVTYRGVAFLTVASEETLVHELVHLATLHLVQRYFAGGKGLTAAQKDAVRELEKMLQPFLALPNRNEAIRSAQMEVRLRLEQGEPALAINEMLAWSLANTQIANQLTENEAPGVLKKVAKTIRALMRKLLGLPNNTAVETFLDQLSSNFHRLARRPRLADTTSALAAFQRLVGPVLDSHAARIEATYKQFQVLLSQLSVRTLPKLGTQAVQDEAEALMLRADQELAMLEGRGFALSDQEQLLFRTAQAVLGSHMALDPVVMTELDKLFAHAAANLDETAFLADPNTTDELALQQARAQHSALFSDARRRTDTQGRSTLLSNFVAMGLSHAPLREALARLAPPKAEARGETFDARLRDWVSRSFDWISERALGTGQIPSQKLHLDRLAWRLGQIHTQAIQRAARTERRNLVDRLEDKVQTGFAWADSRAEDLANNQAMNGYVRQSVQWLRGVLSDQAAEANAETALELATQPKVPQVVTDLVSELAGNTPSTARLHRLVNLTRHAVSRVRQQLREEAPADVRGFFKQTLSPATWARLHKSVGQVDLQALGTLGMAQLRDVVLDANQRQQAVNALLAQLGPNQALYEQEAQVLARAIVRKDVAPRYRNAEALAALFEQVQVSPKQVKRLTPLLDRLVSLYALEHLSQEERSELGRLLEQEQEGMQKLLNTMRTLVSRELRKGDQRQRMNRWKGYLPQSTDPRSQLVLATPKQAEDLVKRGYKFVGMYRKDALDPSQDLAYYAVNWIGGQATFNQGALQTVEGTLSGVDALTGQSLDPGVGTLIVNPGVVSSIAKQHVGPAQRLLTPIYNADGEVVAYERVLDPAVVAQYTGGQKDLALSIGIWLGRQAEEELANNMNGQVVQTLQQRWAEDRRAGREAGYVAINLSQDPVIQDTWATIPRHTQDQLLSAFGGKVMIRRDMLRNAVGYRSASVADAFSGMSTLPSPVRRAIVDAAYLLPGMDYKKLIAAEKAIQGAVGTAKDWIVVRSGVVAIANGVANLFQLVASGINPLELPKLIARKAQETEIYLRNEKRLARIRVELAAVKRPDARNKLLLEQQRLMDANSRLSIAPLVFAGELPTIAEGLSEHDEYTLTGDFMKWVEKKAEALPQGVLTAAKFATISKDTALYQGLNRMVQFGDFTAKAVLYDHWIAKGMEPGVALEKISERFVNYNLNAGRTRDYLESMGLLWFWNYKLRVQKIVLATIRENPLRFLMSVSGADWVNSDSLLTSAAPFIHWDYSIGPDQLFRAPEATFWHQVFR